MGFSFPKKNLVSWVRKRGATPFLLPSRKGAAARASMCCRVASRNRIGPSRRNVPCSGTAGPERLGVGAPALSIAGLLTPRARATARDPKTRGEAEALANRREWATPCRSSEAVVNNACLGYSTRSGRTLSGAGTRLSALKRSQPRWRPDPPTRLRASRGIGHNPPL
jgi:hypothetical protein